MPGPKDPVDRRKTRVNRFAIVGNPNIDEVTVTPTGTGKKPIDVILYDAAGNVLSVIPISGIVDTELPPAVTLVDSMTLAQSPSVIAAMYGWNGATWDRLKKGQQTMANSLAVTMASNQTALTALVHGVQKTNEVISVDPILVAGRDPADIMRTNLTDTIGANQVVMGLVKIRVDNAGGGVTYVGEAAPGAATSAAVWRIKRITDSGSPTDTDVDWADGNINFDNIYDNRAALSYS